MGEEEGRRGEEMSYEERRGEERGGEERRGDYILPYFHIFSLFI